jgi:hypothetical protein
MNSSQLRGITPIGEVLRLWRDRRWDIPANIEYYPYGKALDAVAEVKRCYEYMRKALAS